MPARRLTQLTMMPGHVLRSREVSLTDRHRPMKSELRLTATFAARETLLNAYQDGIIANVYLFHEFGDSALIV